MLEESADVRARRGREERRKLELLERDQRAIYILLTIMCPVFILWWIYKWVNEAGKKDS